MLWSPGENKRITMLLKCGAGFFSISHRFVLDIVCIMHFEYVISYHTGSHIRLITHLHVSDVYDIIEMPPSYIIYNFTIIPTCSKFLEQLSRRVLVVYIFNFILKMVQKPSIKLTIL